MHIAEIDKTILSFSTCTIMVAYNSKNVLYIRCLVDEYFGTNSTNSNGLHQTLI